MTAVGDLPDGLTVVGTGAQGATHHLHPRDRVVYVVRDGRVVQQQPLPAGSLERWIDAVRSQAGWDELRYDDRSLGEWLAEQVDRAPAV